MAADITVQSTVFAVISIWSIPLSDGAVVPRSQFSQESKSSNDSNFVVSIEEAPWSQDAYLNKICKGEPTCHLVEYAPKEFQTMQYRNCMCDEDCAIYGDCCKDSKYYDETEQKTNYKSFHCSQDKVYVKATCPPHYVDHNIKIRCEKSLQPLDEDDTKLIQPVTNTHRNLTYANEYCAACNGDYDYQLWNLTSYCSQDFTPVNADDLLDTNANGTDGGGGNNNNVTRDYFWETSEATKYITFDPVSKTFRSTFNGRSYTCSFWRTPPLELLPHLRICVPSNAECSNTSDSSLVERCHSYTSVGFYDFEYFRNKECAACNGKSKTFSCTAASSVLYTPGSELFEAHKNQGGNSCDDPKIKEKFC